MHKRTRWPCSIARVVVGLLVVTAAAVAQNVAPPLNPDAWRSSGEPPHASAPEGESPESTTYWVAMPDGILLATEVSLPTTAEPYPTVLVRTPYSRFNPGGVGVNVNLYLQEGYAIVVQETRGRWDSQGTWYFWKDDPADGHATIEWIAQQSWSNGKVGMLGRSGAGVTQYAVAQGAPAALKCLAPAHESPDRYHLAFHGGAVFYDLVYNWLDHNGLGYLYDVLLEHRLWDDWYDDWLASPDTVQVPSFHMGRWYDFGQRGALDAFRVYQHQGGAGATGNQYLYMDPLTHWGNYGPYSHPPSPIPFEDFRQQLQLDWLGYWLKDEATGVDAWPAVRIYLMGEIDEPAAPGNSSIELDDWPPPATAHTLYLSQDGGLLQNVPAAGQLILLIDPLDPVPTYGGANCYLPSGPWDQAAYPDGRPIESRADVLSFTTEPLTVPTTVIGPVTATIWIEPDTSDLDLSVRLTDVYPDGKSILVTDGIQRARMRCGDDVECFLTPGAPTEIEVDLWSTAVVFNAGHRIRVAIAGTNWSRFERNSNDGGDLNNPNYIVAHPEILFGPEHPSSVELPIALLMPFSDDFESGDTSAWSSVVP